MQYETEKLVDLARISGGRIICRNDYFRRGIPGAVNAGLVRETVAEKLLAAAELLPDGCRFLVYDGWRPYAVQHRLYCDYFCTLGLDDAHAQWSVQQLRQKAGEFVAFPRRGEEFSYAHSSGGAVDLTILGKDGNLWEMGSGFDEFSPRSHTDYYERRDPALPEAQNRRFLQKILTEQGFVNLPEEWWHFDFGNKNWAAKNACEPLYPSIYDLPPYLTEKVESLV